MDHTSEQSQGVEIYQFEEQLKGLPQIRIGLDGVASAGKGTLNKFFQERLSLAELPTGDMYRAATWFLLGKFGTEGVVDKPDNELRSALHEFDIQFQYRGRARNVFVSDPRIHDFVDISDHLQDPQISEKVSAIAKRDPVRDVLEKEQRMLVELTDKIVAEGRDMWKILQGINGVNLMYLYADDETLIAREKQRHADLGRIITTGKARELTVVRNIADNARDRGQLLLPDQVLPSGTHGKVYSYVLDTSKLTPEAVYRCVVQFLYNQYFPQKG